MSILLNLTIEMAAAAVALIKSEFICTTFHELLPSSDSQSSKKHPDEERGVSEF